ncbi:MAG: hypothetical protein CML66_14035 [Rhodobacteraceae bacterium]|nr:hypothetical protein [Paracoccaceae bacterium]MAY46767.1 hypothetical protein [Paracoccaceae bacterium]QEW21117.1 hypothetical protein LA6_003322 [Marinibacterium anthonyi]
MAEYVFNSYYGYARDGGSENASQTSATDEAGVLTDEDGNSTFDPGETLYVDGSPVGTFYAGYFPGDPPDINNFYIVVEVDDDNFIIYGYPGTADSDLPNTFHEIDDVDPEETITECFAAGTQIATPTGEQSVETLAIGDMITTADGRDVPVMWIGRQTVHKLFTPAERFQPVRVTRGALGRGLPHSDLVLTADHALILDGLAINAGALINETTIRRDPLHSLADHVTYYHVETREHDAILANGAAAETYVDYVSRRFFDNYSEYLSLYGEERVIAEMGMPRISAARLVPQSIRAGLDGLRLAG